MCPQPSRCPPPAPLPLDGDTVAEPPNGLVVPLGRALRRGAVPERAAVRRWLRDGFALDGRDDAGRTALICAAAAGARELVPYLVGQGARVNATDACGYTALARAALAGHDALAGYLRSRGASPNAVAPLFDAVRAGAPHAVQALLRQGASVHLRDRAGNTALHCAAAHRQPAVARALLARGGDPRARNARGESALEHAVRLRDWRLTALLEAGREPVGPLAHWRARLRHAWPRPARGRRRPQDTRGR